MIIVPKKEAEGDDESIDSNLVDEDIMAKVKKEGSVVTMSGFLNAIDGVSSQVGRALTPLSRIS